MSTGNFTPAEMACQAEPPDSIAIRHDGKDYTLKWVRSKSKYRLHLHHLPTRRDTYYGPDPADARRAVLERLPALLALAPQPTTTDSEQPKHLYLTHRGIEYKLTRHKSGEYRRKLNGQDKYFGHSAAQAKDDFYARSH